MPIDWRGEQYRRRLIERISRALHRGGILLQGYVRERLRLGRSSITSGGRAGPPGAPPYQQTGQLLRSIQVDTRHLRERSPRVRVGTNLRYAAIQELGGKIRPVRGQYLTVPIGVEGKRLMRKVGRGGLRTLAEPRVFRLGRTNVLAIRRGKKIVPVIALRKQVTLPPRPYLASTLRMRRDAVIAEIVAQSRL